MSKLAQINRAKNAFNSSLLVTLINTLVFSKLHYCSTVWSSTTACNVQKLQLVQNFAARIISGTYTLYKFEHVTPSLKNLRWLPVKKQLYLQDAVFAFKCMMGCTPTYLTSQFVKRQQISSRTTRNSQQLNIPPCKTTAGQRSFYYRIVKLWNFLDKDLKLCKSHLNFKKTLKTKLLSEFLN